MSLAINHNISSLNGQRNLAKNDQMINKSLERLSSGMKINRAADSAAGLVISEQMRAQIGGLKQAMDNSNTAVSMVQTTEGALDEINSLLLKARELTLHAANSGANDTNQLVADQGELDNVIKSVTRISEVTQFGTKKLLDGSLNGATSLGAGLTRVKVGNLANNSAISAGTVTLTVTGGKNEANTLKASTGSSDNYVFSAAVTGYNMGAASGTTKVVSGTVVTLNITGTAVSVTVAAGGVNASGLETALNTAVSTTAGISGFTVAYDETNGGFKVTDRRDVYKFGTTDFTASMSMVRAAGADTPGAKEAITASVTIGSGSAAATVAANLFTGAANLTSITSGTVITATGLTFTATISTSTGMFQIKVSGNTTDGANEYASGATLGDVLAKLKTALTGASTKFDAGTNFTVGAGTASGLTITLARGTETDKTDFTFSLEIDLKNNVTATPDINFFKVAGLNTGGASSTVLTGNTSGIASLTGASSGDTLQANNEISLTVNGITVRATGGQTLEAVATSLETKLIATGFTTAKVYFGSTAGATGIAGLDLVTTGGAASGGFYVVDTASSQYSVSLSVDQSLGSDVNIATPTSHIVIGAASVANLNMDTSAQVRTNGADTTNGHPPVTITNATGSTVNVNGQNATASLSVGTKTLTLTTSVLTASGAATMTLDSTAAGNSGFQDLAVELSTGVTSAGGSVTFTLGNGAEFQIGANANTTGKLDQKVGVTIESVAATELGRSATGAGTLLSLNDLVSTQQGALTNGKTTEALKVIDKAIDDITGLRGKLGSFQSNTLETNLNSLKVSNENLTAAESLIRDTDFASESANFTKNQILVQAATAMLAQANQLPQGVLKLLG